MTGHVLDVPADPAVLKRSDYGRRRFGWGGMVYSVRIAVKQVEPGAVDLLRATFGGGAPRDPEITDAMEAVYWRAKALNRVGVVA